MPERNVPGDFVDFLAKLNAHGVEFLVVGGYAVYFHGHPRDTGDIDIVIKPDLENARRLVSAVAAFGAGGLGNTAEDYLSGDFIQIGISPVRIDITSAFDGVASDRLWSEPVDGSIGGVPVRFPSKACLLLNKRAAGRPKDLRDVEALQGPDAGKP